VQDATASTAGVGILSFVDRKLTDEDVRKVDAHFAHWCFRKALPFHGRGCPRRVWHKQFHVAAE